MDDMKECAHCGGKPIRRKESGDERDGYANRVEISCINCGASVRASGDTSKGGYADNSTVDARAIAAWNRRAVPQANAEQDARRVGTLYAAIQKAAGELPEGYTIKIEVERDAGWVEWAGPDCEWKLSDGNDGYMCQAVEEAVDAAIRAASNATSPADAAKRE